MAETIQPFRPNAPLNPGYNPSQGAATEAVAAWETSSPGAIIHGLFGNTFSPVEGYSPTASLRDEANKDLQPFAGYMLGSYSPEEFDYKAAYIRRQLQNREILASGGLFAMVAEGVADFLNPINLGGLGYVRKGATALERVGRMSRVGSIQSGGSVASGEVFDPTTDATDVIVGAGSGALLGGALWGGVELAGAARAMFIHKTLGDPRMADFVGNPLGARGVGADAAGVSPSAPGMEAPARTGLGIEKIGTSPYMRALNSEPEISEFAQEMFPTPHALGKHEAGIASGDKSMWTAFKMNWEPQLFDLVTKLEGDFAAYRGRPGETGWFQRSVLAASDALRGSGQHLNRTQFMERAWEQLRTRNFDDTIPEVNSTARRYAQFYDEAAERLVGDGFFEDLSHRTFAMRDRVIIEHYSGSRVWNKGEINRNPDGFRLDFERYKAELPDKHPHLKLSADDALRIVRQDLEYVAIDDDLIGKAGATRRRSFDVPSEFFKRWINRDIDVGARFYARTAGIDMEIGRRSKKDGKPDITMRERIREAMRTYPNLIDDKFDEKGIKRTLDKAGSRMSGPANRSFDAMQRNIDEERRRVGLVYAKANEIFEKGGDVTDMDMKDVNVLRAAELANKYAKSENWKTDIAAELRAERDAKIDAEKAFFRDRLVREFPDETAPGKSGKMNKGGEIEELVRKMFDAERDMLDLRDALRGTLGQSRDPLSLTARAVRLIKQFANMTVLTGATAAASDIGNIVMRFGADRAFGALFREMSTGLSAIKASRPDLQRMAVGLELHLNARIASMTDLGDIQGRYTMFERGMDAANSQVFMLNLLTPWTNFGQELTGTLVIDEVIRLSKRVADKQTLTHRESIMLSQSGIDQSMLKRIAAQAGTHAEQVDGLWIGGVNKWTDAGARDAMRRMVHEDVRRVIVEPHKGEIPVILSTEIGSVIFQYKAFAVATVNRIMVPALQRKDMQAMTGVMSMVAAGYMVDQLRHAQSDMSNVDRPLSVQIGRAIERSGVMGYFTDIGRALDTVTDNRFGWGALFGEPPRKQDVTDLLGPGVQQIKRAGRLAGDVVTGDFDRSTARDFRKLLYMQNFVGADWMFDALERSIAPETLASQRR
jgi:hypothetical protein